MDVGMMMVFASYGWENCSDDRVWDEEIRLARLAADLGLRLPVVGRAPLQRLLVRARQPPAHDLSDGAAVPNIDLGTAAVILPWHDPLRVAEKAAVLDMLSKGRLRLGIGRGLARREFAAFRLSMDESRERFDEAAPMIVNALKTGFIEGDGQYYKQPRIEIRPRPQHSFDGRIYAVASSEDFGRFRRQARRPHGDVRRPAVGDAAAGDRARPRAAPQVPRHRAAAGHADRVLRLRHQPRRDRGGGAPATRASSSRAISTTTNSWASTSRR